ncbi:MAG: ribosome maturation factor RimP [Acidimicrobiales bacterium]
MTTVTDRVHDVVAPVLEQLGLDLYDVEHRGGMLRITVTREGGVDLDAIADATRAVSRALDESDPIPGRYTLEVSSPGLERALRTPGHFAAAVGDAVTVKTKPDVEGERRVAGQLVSADDHTVTVRADDGAERTLRFDQIDKARTVFEWGKKEVR